MPEAEGGVSPAEAAARLGEGVEERHVRARIRRGTLHAAGGSGGEIRVDTESIERSLSEAPACGACPEPATTYVVVKYPHHDRVEFSLCADHGADAVRSYARRGGLLEVVSYPYQSEAWLKVE